MKGEREPGKILTRVKHHRWTEVNYKWPGTWVNKLLAHALWIEYTRSIAKALWLTERDWQHYATLPGSMASYGERILSVRSKSC